MTYETKLYSLKLQIFQIWSYIFVSHLLQALIDYIKSDFDISVYWNTLNTNGITKERLLSYDRAIRNEPKFRRDQKDSLLRDLGNYMRTLKVCTLLYLYFYFQPNLLQSLKSLSHSHLVQAVHSGADLESAITNCMGYKSEVMSLFWLCFST